MPELPEVETVRRTLEPLVGYVVTGVTTSGLPLHMNRPIDVAALRKATIGGRVESLRRWGKYLLVDFEDRDGVLLVHLGMTGRLRLMPPREPAPPHTHVELALRGRPRRMLRYADARRFGWVSVARRGAERTHPRLAHLGLDPLTDRLDGPVLARLARECNKPLKVFLLDQSRIAGIGNIYASEALWRARLRPESSTRTLDARRAAALARGIRDVLERALTHGGTSLRDFVTATGDPGNYRHYLRVYDREGERCERPRCRGRIRRTITQGRATFFCPSCQKA